MKPSHPLHTMTVSSTSGIRRLMHLHRNLKNPAFAKLMNCCTHQNKRQSRISRNIRYSAVGSSQKKRWICQLPLVSLNERCFVYIMDRVVAGSGSIFCITVHQPVPSHVLLMWAFVSCWLHVAAARIYDKNVILCKHNGICIV